jgi:hypothetical protein
MVTMRFGNELFTIMYVLIYKVTVIMVQTKKSLIPTFLSLGSLITATRWFWIRSTLFLGSFGLSLNGRFLCSSLGMAR